MELDMFEFGAKDVHLAAIFEDHLIIEVHECFF